MFDKLHARKTGPTCSKKKNRIECPFKREDQLAQRKRIYSNVLLKGYIVGPLTLHQKGVFFGSQNSCHILVGKSTLSISNLKWWKTPTQNRTGSVFEKKLLSLKNHHQVFRKVSTHTHTKLNIFAGRLCRPKEMARVKFQTKSPRRILSGNVGRLCVALWKSEYESQDEGGRREDKILMLNHVQGDLGNPFKNYLADFFR